MKRTIFLLFVSIVLKSSFVFALSSVPASLTFDGTLTDQQGVAINLNNESIRFSLVGSVSRSCAVYSETQLFTSATGEITHQVGKGAVYGALPPLDASAFYLRNAGKNLDDSLSSCVLNNSESRVLRVESIERSIALYIELSSMPYALVAQNSFMLNGKQDTDFLLRTNNFSDVSNISQARSNLGLGSLATLSVLSPTHIPAASGDVTGAYSALSVQKINGIAVNFNSLTDGQAFVYSSFSNEIVNKTLKLSHIKNLTDTAPAFPVSACQAHQTLVYSTTFGSFSCSDLTINASQVNFPSQGAGKIFMAPAAADGAPSFRNIALSDLPYEVVRIDGGIDTHFIPMFSDENKITQSVISQVNNVVFVDSNDTNDDVGADVVSLKVDGNLEFTSQHGVKFSDGTTQKFAAGAAYGALYRSTALNGLSTSWLQVNMDNPSVGDLKSTTYSASLPYKLFANISGVYAVTYSVNVASFDNGSSRYFCSRLMKSGSLVKGSTSCVTVAQNGNHQITKTMNVRVNANEYLYIQVKAENSNLELGLPSTVIIENSDSVATLSITRISD